MTKITRVVLVLMGVVTISIETFSQNRISGQGELENLHTYTDNNEGRIVPVRNLIDRSPSIFKNLQGLVELDSKISAPSEAFIASADNLKSQNPLANQLFFSNNPETFEYKNTAGILAAGELDPGITRLMFHHKKITTLGRGGSDLTASIIGSALGAEEVQVWKDVDGLMTTDPKVVADALIVNEISFEEASELAYFGAKILHPQSMLPAMDKNIPVRVKNSFSPESPGTVIKKNVLENAPVKVITFQRKITLIDIVSTRMLGLSGFLAHVFQVFAKYDLSVDMIASSEISISLTLNKNAKIHSCLPSLVSDLQEIASVRTDSEKAMVTIIGDVRRSTETLATAFKILKDENIAVQMVGQGASKVNMSLIIDNSELDRAVKVLHGAFFN